MDNEKAKCPFCKSTNVRCFGEGKVIEENEINESKIDESKIDSKEEPYYEPKQWNTEFNTKKYLCRNCGMIFEIMPNEFLKLYNEQSKLFKNKD
ncbi:hypothetical protein [Clostridium tyrobutyricum]|uniref:hypothetical protein n=1 Tax=Clostridium tyrobutyricum TaxID=1519 RepID=UPI00241C9035|nr:hypothetical protein [Clostridium tyrobutyricum]